MKLLYSFLIVVSFTLSACYVNSVQPVNTSQNQQFKADSNKCFAWCVSPGIYNVVIKEHLTYSPEEAKLYPHDLREIVLEAEKSKWELQRVEGCISDNPSDCQVYCFKEYQAVLDTFFEPTDPTLGTPFYKNFVVIEQESQGAERFEEVDCALLEWNDLDVEFEKGSAQLSDFSQTVIDNDLISLFTDTRGVKIEISAYTDSRGPADRNQLLSEQRAQAIVNYLVETGMSASRLVAIGHGDGKLRHDCKNGKECTNKEHEEKGKISFRALNQ